MFSKSKSVFYLRSFLVNKEFDQHYPGIKLEKGRRGIFDSLRKAERAIREMVARSASNTVTVPYAFHIIELYGNATYKDTILSERLYGADGSLIERTLRADISAYDTKLSPKIQTRYPGRAPEQIRFQVGDLVEVLIPKDGVTKLMIIGRTPFSPEKVRELESDPEDPATDIPDEYACFDPLDGKRFQYVSPTRLLTPTFPLDESVRETYRSRMAQAAEKRVVPRRTWS